MVTQRDIAKALNISNATVSRAFNNGKITESTKKLILDKAKEMGYVEDSSAKFLALKNPYIVEVFIFNSLVENYTSEVIKGFKSFEKNSNNKKFKVNINIIEAPFNLDERVKLQKKHIIQTLKSPLVKGILFSNIHNATTEYLIKECSFKNITVGTFDMVDDSENALFHVSPDYKRLGRIAGELLSKLLNKNGKILVLDFNEGYNLGHTRLKGFLDCIETYKFIDVIIPEKLNTLTKEDFYNFLNRHLKSDINGIFPIYRAEYVAEYILDYNLLNRDLKLISNDLNEDIEKYLKLNIIDAVIYQNPFHIGYTACKLIYNKIFFNSENEKNIVIKESILLKESL